MSEAIARRYAVALADVVLKTDETFTVEQELRDFEKMIAGSENLQTVFGNPSIRQSDKTKILESLLAKMQPTRSTANFLRVLLQNGRLTDLEEINGRFDIELEERSGTVSAYTTSARELSEEQKNELKANLEKLTGRTVTMNYAVDSEIIGGVVTKVGSTVYDGSVRTQLENLREQLVNA